MSGSPLWVTFLAKQKGNWPRAAAERAGGTRQSSFHQPLRQTQSERLERNRRASIHVGVYQFVVG